MCYNCHKARPAVVAFVFSSMDMNMFASGLIFLQVYGKLKKQALAIDLDPNWKSRECFAAIL